MNPELDHANPLEPLFTYSSTKLTTIIHLYTEGQGRDPAQLTFSH